MKLSLVATCNLIYREIKKMFHFLQIFGVFCFQNLFFEKQVKLPVFWVFLVVFDEYLQK